VPRPYIIASIADTYATHPINILENANMRDPAIVASLHSYHDRDIRVK